MDSLLKPVLASMIRSSSEGFRSFAAGESTKAVVLDSLELPFFNVLEDL